MTKYHDLSECDQNILLSLIITASFSILAGCMILISFVFIKKIRTYTFGLIFVMTVAEVISRMAYVLNYNPPDTGSWQCYTQAFVIQYFISLSMYFSLAVAGHMYSLIIARHVFRMTRELFVKVVVVACVVALICACVPFTTDQYGNIGAFCWILLEKDTEGEGDDDDKADRDSGYSMRAGLMHGQIWVIYILNSIFYTRIYKFISQITRDSTSTDSQTHGRSSSNSNSNRMTSSDFRSSRKTSSAKDNSVEKTVRILQYYPIILIVTWCPLIIMRVFEYSGFHIPCWVLAFSLGMTNLQGLCNAIVFFLYDSVRQNWKAFFGIVDKTPPLVSSRTGLSSSQNLSKSDCSMPTSTEMHDSVIELS